MQVIWTAPVTNGSPIISYQLQYMLFGGSTWIEACGDTTGSYLGTSFTITTNIVGGKTYSVRVRAKNVWGWGAYSAPAFQILAAASPSTVSIPQTSIDPTAGGVKI